MRNREHEKRIETPRGREREREREREKMIVRERETERRKKKAKGGRRTVREVQRKCQIDEHVKSEYGTSSRLENAPMEALKDAPSPKLSCAWRLHDYRPRRWADHDTHDHVHRETRGG